MKRFLKWFGAVWLIASVAFGVYFWPRIDQWLRFSPSVQAANFAAPATPQEARQQDLQYLASILDYDRSFSPEQRAEFLSLLSDAKARAAGMNEAQFLMETHALMALADNAHTGSDSVAAFRQFNRSGLEFFPFADGYYAVRAHQSNKSLLGQELVSIDGHDITAVMNGLARYSGGPEAQRTYSALNFLRSPDLLHAAGLADNPDTITVILRDRAGAQTEHELAALPPVAETEFYYRHPYHALRAEPLPDEGEEWVRVVDGKAIKAPLTLRDDGDLVKAVPMGGGMYVRSNYLVEYPEHEVKSQLVAALSGAPDGGFPFVIVDLRWNPGGDLGNAMPFARRLGEALSTDGKAYVLVGPQTFSAAIVAAALIKQNTGDRMVLVGQPMGDRMQFWAERGESFVLPNSGYFISYSTGYHDWENGCSSAETEHCFSAAERNAKPIGKLNLDHPIQPTFAQYASGQDPVLDWVLGQEAR
ncbi:hypothetical protein FGU71_10350 [Erythrobacter insulae]|uniref:Peptidase S41 n=1 Tax=Erythrobacter insulae TaxID=2584124 RepID=A0A547PDK8_9SPHN|nr:hypothetical protein [Erythrobacter insulae]TRD12222.1 hypothetical protein FGU71_10350 [Erythrobacter insulae]